MGFISENSNNFKIFIATQGDLHGVVMANVAVPYLRQLYQQAELQLLVSNTGEGLAKNSLANSPYLSNYHLQIDQDTNRLLAAVDEGKAQAGELQSFSALAQSYNVQTPSFVKGGKSAHEAITNAELTQGDVFLSLDPLVIFKPETIKYLEDNRVHRISLHPANLIDPRQGKGIEGLHGPIHTLTYNATGKVIAGDIPAATLFETAAELDGGTPYQSVITSRFYPDVLRSFLSTYMAGVVSAVHLIGDVRSGARTPHKKDGHVAQDLKPASAETEVKMNQLGISWFKPDDVAALFAAITPDWKNIVSLRGEGQSLFASSLLKDIRAFHNNAGLHK